MYIYTTAVNIYFFIFMLLMINFVTVGTILFWEAGGGEGGGRGLKLS
jgi:hypothetical protein